MNLTERAQRYLDCIGDYWKLTTTQVGSIYKERNGRLSSYFEIIQTANTEEVCECGAIVVNVVNTTLTID